MPRALDLLLPAALLILFSCTMEGRPEDVPWCTMPVSTPRGLLYPNGVLEVQEKRHYLPISREGKQVGLALARHRDGTLVVCDIALWGPADRAGLRPGQMVAAGQGNRAQILDRLARQGGPLEITGPGPARTLTGRPLADIRGHSQLELPLLVSISGDCSRLELALPLNLAAFSWRRVEKEPAKTVHRIGLSLFFGLIEF